MQCLDSLDQCSNTDVLKLMPGLSISKWVLELLIMFRRLVLGLFSPADQLALYCPLYGFFSPLLRLFLSLSYAYWFASN